ncbi:MAG TPA: 50S ribosomal protein L30 [Gemmatimonadota bacterium]|nr:50S ribosomal protein L30 [Gemmatimonadota bacterium]
MAAKARRIVITQIRSAIGQPQRIRDTLRALGIRRHQQSIERTDGPAIRGMIASVHHLVTVEEA